MKVENYIHFMAWQRGFYGGIVYHFYAIYAIDQIYSHSIEYFPKRHD